MSNIDLSRRPERREELAAWYSAALHEQETSGLSVAEYAEELGVTAATLYQWRRKLGAASRGFGLVEVLGQSAAPASAEQSSFVVGLGGNREVEVPHGFDEQELRRLVTVLESC